MPLLFKITTGSFGTKPTQAMANLVRDLKANGVEVTLEGRTEIALIMNAQISIPL